MISSRVALQSGGVCFIGALFTTFEDKTHPVVVSLGSVEDGDVRLSLIGYSALRVFDPINNSLIVVELRDSGRLAKRIKKALADTVDATIVFACASSDLWDQCITELNVDFRTITDNAEDRAKS